jgi:HEAT repeat protein
MKRARSRTGVVSALAILLSTTALASSPRVMPVVMAQSTNAPSSTNTSGLAASQSGLVLHVFGSYRSDITKRFAAETLGAPEVLQLAATLRITELDVERDEKSAAAFGIRAIPALVLATEDGKIISRQEGFLQPRELVAWVEAGRKRAAEGLWEGTAATPGLEALSAKGTMGRLETNEVRELMVLIGSPDPAVRNQAGRVLAGLREEAVPPLINALADPYLGTRITAFELLRGMAPDVPAMDPWQSPAASQDAVAGIRAWWKTTGKLPPPSAIQGLSDASATNSVLAALEALREENPARRTEAMTRLVARGAVALPAIRKAIRQRDTAGDQRTVWLLEDVRWAILVPDTLEQRVGGVRHALARGSSPERQAATSRLEKAGPDALPALTELAGDADPLVVECALRSLSSTGGAAAIASMRALLQSDDANLRSTAAQSLGRTALSEALAPLAGAVDDPDEIVVCTALSGIQQILAEKREYSSKPKPLDPVLVKALERAMADPRWRVRATAAETAGKIKATELKKPLRSLLEDKDGFVVRNTLKALEAMNDTPEPGMIAGLVRRLPSLRSEAMAMLIEPGGDEAGVVATDFYNAGNENDRLAILNSMLRSSRSGESNAWTALVERGLSETTPSLRRAAADVALAGSTNTLVVLVAKMLADDDPSVFQSGAEGVLWMLAGKTRASSRYSDNGLYFSESSSDSSSPSKKKTNNVATVQRYFPVWRSNLVARVTTSTNLIAAIAAYLTGTDTNDLSLLLAASARLDDAQAGRMAETPAVTLLLPRIPWPDGREVLERLASRPLLFIQIAAGSRRAPQGVGAWVLDAGRFEKAISGIRSNEFSTALEALGKHMIWTQPGGRNGSLLGALCLSTNTLTRALAAQLAGMSMDATLLPALEKLLGDPDTWVRVAAVKSVSRLVPERAKREALLLPALGRSESSEAGSAAVGLLQEEVRNAAGLSFDEQVFEFGETRVRLNSSYSSSSSDRPLTPLEARPQIIEPARAWLGRAKGTELAGFAVLLAQYGDFSGIDPLAESWKREPSVSSTENQSLLTAIALSRDTKHIALLRLMMEKAGDEYDLRRVLAGLRGMTGPEARQLRMEINQHIREKSD